MRTLRELTREAEGMSAVAIERDYQKSLPILCLDFDGVIHSYKSGWGGAEVIPDPPVPGAIEFIVRAVEKFRVAIFSSRTHQKLGLMAMQCYLKLQLARVLGEEDGEAERVYALIEWPREKPPAMVSIDDRAITFTGVWPAIEDLLAFKPWNKP
jgi:hypothetical protein